MILKIIKLTFILILIPSILFANTKYFEDGVNFYKNKKFKKAKFKFEQDIVLNPKSELKYPAKPSATADVPMIPASKTIKPIMNANFFPNV